MTGAARWGGVGGRFVLAYLWLASFWASAEPSPSAFEWVGGAEASRWAGAPGLLGAAARLLGVEALAAWPGALLRAIDALLPPPLPEPALRHGVLALLSPEVQAWSWRNDIVASLVGGALAPLALAALAARGAAELGLRRPTSAGFTCLGAAYLASLPALLVAGVLPGFRRAMAIEPTTSLWYPAGLVVGVAVEHLLFHGPMLAWLHPSGRFPREAAVAGPLDWRRHEPSLARRLAHLGRSLAIPADCWPAVALSALLFCAIHAGKADVEYWLSLPAGAVFAWAAYRTNGPLVPALLHLATAATVALVALVAGNAR